jgi:16S rRNA (cytidine1402-2'-O)-methyltransferase
MLYIVSTPIGNLKDITLRALETLKSVDLIAAEDTRHTKILLSHYQIETQVTSYYEHNQVAKGEYILRLLKEGKNVAMVTDAGTPGISDPGYHLIDLAKKNDIPLTVIPGPTAMIAALSLSGLPSHRFVFEGFLPVKQAARRKKLQSLKQEKGTILFYESPYRVLKSLEDIKEEMNDPYVVCAREITKKFEEVKSGKASELVEYFLKKTPKGEFVILINLEKEKEP